MRALAAEPGVSPALVIHHFGSKDALRAACDEHVLRLIREAETEAFTSSTPVDLLGQLALLDEFAPMVGYLVQALLAGGDLAATLLARMTADAEVYLAEAVAAGRMRPSRDPPRGRPSWSTSGSAPSSRSCAGTRPPTATTGRRCGAYAAAQLAAGPRALHRGPAHRPRAARRLPGLPAPTTIRSTEATMSPTPPWRSAA